MRSTHRAAHKILAAVLVVGLPFGAAYAQSSDLDMRSVSNRLDRIENEISDLQRQSYGGGASTGAPRALDGGASSSDLYPRVMDLEEQVRSLTGRLEEANHRATEAQRQLDLFKADVEMRFQDLQDGGMGAVAPRASTGNEGRGAAQSAPEASETFAAQGSSSERAPSSVLPNGTPEAQYDFAIDLMKRGQYDNARVAFQEFLSRHPNHNLAGNSQYWLGESYYAQNDYKRAGDAFLTGYTTYASSSKAPDSLLKLGMSLAALGNKDAACTVWGELGSKFPQASPAVVARAQLERRKAGC